MYVTTEKEAMNLRRKRGCMEEVGGRKGNAGNDVIIF